MLAHPGCPVEASPLRGLPSCVPALDKTNSATVFAVLQSTRKINFKSVALRFAERHNLHMATPKKQHPSEHQEQAALWAWRNLSLKTRPQLASLFAVPNAGKRTQRMGMYMKAEGLEKGVPDLIFLYPASGYHGLAIEMKSMTGKTTPEQKEWLERLAKDGYYTAVCRGWLEAKQVLEDYLGGELEPR